MACDCTNNGIVVCGTGLGTVAPLPGDPSNNINLRAVGVVGGADVYWTYPTVNPHAVSYIRVLRGITEDPDEAIERTVVSGNTFFDRISDSEIRKYYYWIQLVSVNGTVGSLIGPASATPLKFSAFIRESIEGGIEESWLESELRARIEGLDILRRDLSQEIIDRALANTSLQTALAQVQSENGEAMTYLRNDLLTTKNASIAMLERINALAVSLNDNAAALIEEARVRATADETVTEKIQILFSEFDKNQAVLNEEVRVRTTQNTALVSQLSEMTARIAEQNAAITAERNTRVAENESIASQITNLVAVSNSVKSGLQSEQITRATNDSALAQQIQTAQTQLGQNIASVQTNMQTKIDAVNGTLNAAYTAKVDVNGLVGGFGIHNNGTQVEAAFNVDKFWIGRSGSKTKPFVIEGGVVYIDDARIRNAAIDTLKVKSGAITVSMGGSWNNRLGGLMSNPVIAGALTFSVAPQCVTVIVNVRSSGLGLTEGATFLLKRNGILLRLFPSWKDGTYVITDYPSSGTHTYSIEHSPSVNTGDSSGDVVVIGNLR